MKCKGKHHSSICDKTITTLLTTSSCSGTYTVVFIEIDEVKCRFLLENGVGASDAPSTLIIHTIKKPIRTETKKIELLFSANTRKIKIYSVRIQDISYEFSFETELYYLEKEVLLELPKPKCRELQHTYVNLKDLQINDHDPKSGLPVHVILVIIDYTKMKTRE